MSEQLQIRIHGNETLPTLIYLPGLHGDWTLVTSFRLALSGKARFVEVTYPRTLTWSINDYAGEIKALLAENEITHGWLLGESFGSQVAWALLESKSPDATKVLPRERFRADGLILAGGFIKHPWRWGPGLLRRLGKATPAWARRLMFKFYARYARFRHRHAPEVLATIDEFIFRRTDLDRLAMGHRLALLDDYDPRPIAKNLAVPVYYLAGLVDPLVPWPVICRWLKKNCPAYRGRKVFLRADHNVLATAPVKSAKVVLDWMKTQTFPLRPTPVV